MMKYHTGSHVLSDIIKEWKEFIKKQTPDDKAKRLAETIGDYNIAAKDDQTYISRRYDKISSLDELA